MMLAKSLCLSLVPILVGCDGGFAPTATSVELDPTAQVRAIGTAIQEQFTLTAAAQVIYAPTQTVNAAVQQTAYANSTGTAERVYVITNDAYGAVTATAFARTATRDAINTDPTVIQRTVNALVGERFTSTARAQLQQDIHATVNAAVEQTATAQSRP